MSEIQQNEKDGRENQSRKSRDIGFWRPPGIVFYGVLILASIPAFVSTDWIYSSSPLLLDILVGAYIFLWILFGGYWFITFLWFVAGVRSKLLRNSASAPESKTANIFRWLSSIPFVLFVTIAILFNIHHKITFVHSRLDLETLLSRMAADPSLTAPRRVGCMNIGEVKRLPNGMFQIPTSVGYHWLDAQGLIYSPTPPPTPPNRTQEHLVGCWYKYCDG